MANINYKPQDNYKIKSINLVIREGRMNAEQLRKTEKAAKIFSIALVYIFLTFMALLVLVPFYWMIITSLKSNFEIRNMMTFFPQTIQWTNYTVLFKGAEIG